MCTLKTKARRPRGQEDGKHTEHFPKSFLAPKSRGTTRPERLSQFSGLRYRIHDWPSAQAVSQDVPSPRGAVPAPRWPYLTVCGRWLAYFSRRRKVRSSTIADLAVFSSLPSLDRLHCDLDFTMVAGHTGKCDSAGHANVQ